MCRFVLYLGTDITLGSLVTEPANSIIHQSHHSHERAEPLNGDGFGLAWYVPKMSSEPALFKDITPAWNNQNLINLARVTRSGCILAHVRAATPGFPVIQSNCHPFTCGPYSFMHNGSIGGFRHLRRKLLGSLSDEAFDLIRGSTDSEHVFALFMDHITRAKETGDRTEMIARALKSAITRIEELSEEAGLDEQITMNLAVTDGVNAAVTRYIKGDQEEAVSLYTKRALELTCVDGEYCINDNSSIEKDSAVLIASEPLTVDTGWEKVPPGSIVTVNEDLRLSIRPL